MDVLTLDFMRVGSITIAAGNPKGRAGDLSKNTDASPERYSDLRKTNSSRPSTALGENLELSSRRGSGASQVGWCNSEAT